MSLNTQLQNATGGLLTGTADASTTLVWIVVGFTLGYVLNRSDDVVVVDEEEYDGYDDEEDA